MSSVRVATANSALAIILIASGCAGSGSSPVQSPLAAAHARDVHVAVLAALADRAGTSYIVVAADSWMPGDDVLAGLARRFKGTLGADEALVHDFEARNRTAAGIDAPPIPEIDVRIEPTAMLQPGPDEEASAFWAAFFERHAGAPGWIRLTRPGIAGGRAIVAAELRCGSGCGHGIGFVLTRTEGQWRIEEQRVFWIH